MPVNIQTLNTCKDNLIAVGTSSNFLVYHVNRNRNEQPLCKTGHLCLDYLTKGALTFILDLVNQESPDLIYLIQNSIDPLICQPIDDNEWLLIFARKFMASPLCMLVWMFLIIFFLLLKDYGVYVDNHGKRTRCVELQYPSQPSYASVLRSSQHNTTYLLIFSLTHIDVFDIDQTKWVQTINLKATKPLQSLGDRWGFPYSWHLFI